MRDVLAELKALRLKAPQAMHDPVVLLDQHGIDAALVCNHRQQLIEVSSFV